MPTAHHSASSLEQLFDAAESLQKAGRLEQAIGLYRDWTRCSNDARRHLALFNLGSMLQSLGRLEESARAYEDCLSLAPGFSHALINLGLVHEALGRHEAGVQAWSSVAARRYVDPHQDESLVTTALNHIGRLQENLKRYDLAERALEDSLRLNVSQPGVIQHWLHVRQKACEWPLLERLPSDLSTNDVLMATSPLGELALNDDPAEQLLVAHRFVSRTYPQAAEQVSPHSATRTHRVCGHRRLRIGYLSGDLCTHAVGLLMAEVLEEHDRSRFEIYGYDYSPEDGSVHRRRLLQAFDKVQDIRQFSDEQAAALMANDEIDVLIDLHGLSSGARPGILRQRPAPLQGTWLGYIGATCLPGLDFVVVDHHVAPPELHRYLSEKPIAVEGSFIPLGPTPEGSTPHTRQSHGLPDQAFLMAAFGNSYKINEELFSHWLQLLRDIPHSRLWLIDDNAAATRNLRRHAQRAGIDPDRLMFSPRVSPAEFKSMLRLADVFLDTYPYNCGSTSRDVLAAGLPLITLSGRSMVSRMGRSILSAVGLEHCVTGHFDEYREKVLALADGRLTRQDCTVAPAVLTQTRRRMLRSLERSLQTLWAQHAGRLPATPSAPGATL